MKISAMNSTRVICSAFLALFWVSVPVIHAQLTNGPNATVLKDGKPYRSIGINYFDCFLRTLNKADDTSYDAGFAEPPLSPGFRWGGCGRVEKGNPKACTI